MEVFEACAVVRRGDDLLIAQRGPGGLWAGLWEFPTVHVSGADPSRRAFKDDPAVELAEGVRRLTGVPIEVGPRTRTVRYSVTNHRSHLDVHEGWPLPGGDDLVPGPGLAAVVWASPGELARCVFGTPGRRILKGPGDAGSSETIR